MVQCNNPSNNVPQPSLHQFDFNFMANFLEIRIK
jgi:hypothetical protein